MMDTFIGIDLGTSAVKLLLVAENGKVIANATKAYPITYPRSGWSEQAPENWYNAVICGLKELLKGQDRACVNGIGLGGQMHGLVPLDKDGAVIRPCILWNDGRTEKQTEYLNAVIGREKLTEYTANIAFAGFTAPKLLWLKENEPHNFEKLSKILLPKDYIVYRLCGQFSTDYSDASGTLLLDVKHKKWNDNMLQICSVERSMLPDLHESYEAVGTLLPSIADELGLPKSITICAGAGDNAAAAIGTGTVADGNCSISLGTSGTVFIARDSFSSYGNNALHSFCHATGNYHLLGCILSAASCNSWWMDKILGTRDFASEQNGLMNMLGKNYVFFLPYLMGERSPHNDVNARGAFIGMRLETTRREMTLAVLEGVAFALKDCVEAAKRYGTDVKRTRICGGGSKSKLWQQIISDVMDMPVESPSTEEGPSYGAAILAMVACGAYAGIREAAAITGVRQTIYPDAAAAALYKYKYDVFTRLYPALKNVFRVPE